jgi:hypothetical protein
VVPDRIDEEVVLHVPLESAAVAEQRPLSSPRSWVAPGSRHGWWNAVDVLKPFSVILHSDTIHGINTLYVYRNRSLSTIIDLI